jgi:hypothetical protein
MPLYKAFHRIVLSVDGFVANSTLPKGDALFEKAARTGHA